VLGCGLRLCSTIRRSAGSPSLGVLPILRWKIRQLLCSLNAFCSPARVLWSLNIRLISTFASSWKGGGSSEQTTTRIRRRGCRACKRLFFAREKWTNFYAKALPSEQLTKTTFEPKPEPVCNRKVGHLGHKDVDQTCSSVCVSPSFPSCRWSCWRKR